MSMQMLVFFALVAAFVMLLLEPRVMFPVLFWPLSLWDSGFWPG